MKCRPIPCSGQEFGTVSDCVSRPIKHSYKVKPLVAGKT